MALPLVVLTNDDGIGSPGLWAIAEKLVDFCELWITAPYKQFSGAGKCYSHSDDNSIRPYQHPLAEKGAHIFALGGSPAQTVLLSVMELLPSKPDLVVSGINYAANVGLSSVLASGTIGACMEAAMFGVKSLGLSLEIDPEIDFTSYSDKVDFGNAAAIGARIARKMLSNDLPAGAEILKVDIPSDADLQTPSRLTRLSRSKFYWPRIERNETDQTGKLYWFVNVDDATVEKDSDIYALARDRVISITPLTIDMTAECGSESMAVFLS